MSLGEELRRSIDGKWRHVREQSRAELAQLDLTYDHSLTLDEARERVLDQMKQLVPTGIPAAGFRTENGGTGDPGMAVTGIEMLAQFDLSLMVKAGVQWGLFGGAIENLGTERHHEKYIPALINLDLLGCFAMTETGHGSDVQSLETTATYDPATQEFVVHSPTPSARKDYIGGAAKHARVAAVFARLITLGEDHGVHCFVVPIRDEAGEDLPGVTTSDCGFKGGLGGVDNGRLMFDEVRIPRDNLLNRYGNVDEGGVYSSPIDSLNARFFTMIGTLIRGRVSVGGSARAAAEVALSIASRYALQRRQFEGVPGEETVLMDYRMHQRRLLPLLAEAYAFRFAHNQLVARMHRLQTEADPDAHAQRELEGRAAGLKAALTSFATRAIQECREACGGAGYLAENRLTTLKADSDVFTTFEGDNVVLLQLVAKELLTSYAQEVTGLDPVGMVKFAASTVAETVKERTAAAQLIQRLIDARSRDDDHNLLDRGTQLDLFEDREQHVIETAARRLRRAGNDKGAAFAAFNAAQDHVVKIGQVHIDRVVLEAFTAGIARTEDDAAADVLRDVCSLYALTIIERDKAWFMEHNRISDTRAKAVTTEVNALLEKLRPHTLALVEGLGVPEESLGAEMLG
ncbi:acyl-CoA dehydrogenase family protein [Aeromicrobium sp. Marseille-Q0843]|uniref:acyl-CoA oxidase n=1 Tax=Aeromicrobium phoceense TaxID=2754045 RepID=A0A838XFT3_9ACTN|nr:acyl-CoA dehydrogenase [Aeromicrobium phoceense]MBA4607791.1 acyl-CoA dehydrogenase family protein [Aeromicrobium phoceense]